MHDSRFTLKLDQDNTFLPISSRPVCVDTFHYIRTSPLSSLYEYMYMVVFSDINIILQTSFMTNLVAATMLSINSFHSSFPKNT